MTLSKIAIIVLVITTCGVLSVHISNIWRLETYPFTDLPNHLSEAYLLRALSDSHEPLQSFYRNEVTIFIPGTLHIFFCALFQDVELGNRVFYTMYMIILLLGTVLLVLYVKGDVWVALLSMLFFYNFNTMWGFTSYTMGLGLLLVAVAVLLRFNEKPTLFRALAVGGLMVLLYYCHILIFFFALVAFIVMILAQKEFTHNHILGLIALAPGVILSLVWVNRSSSFSTSTPGFLLDYYHREYVGTMLLRLYKMLCRDNPIAAGREGDLFSLAFCLPLLGGLVGGLLSHKSNNLEGTRTSKARHSAQLFLIVSALCYLFAPDRLPGWAYFYERFSVIFLLGAIGVMSFVIPQKLLPLTRIGVAVMVIVHSGVWYKYFGEFDQVAKPFRTLLYKNPDAAGRSLGAIIADYDFRGTHAFIHYQNYQLIWNGGAVPTKFLEYRFRLFGKRNPEALPNYHEWVMNETWAEWLLGRYKNMDLLLCRGSAALGDTVARRGYDLLGRDEGWMLFRKK